MSTEPRFAAGDWYAVVGERVTVLLPGSQRDRVAQLWDLADSGADVRRRPRRPARRRTLLPRPLRARRPRRRRDPPHRAGRSHRDRVLVGGRGPVVSATPGTTWAERLVAGVTSIRVTLTGDGEADRVLTPGLARVSVVEFGAPSDGGRDPRGPASRRPRARGGARARRARAEPTPSPSRRRARAGAGARARARPEPACRRSAAASASPTDDPTPTGETPVVRDEWYDRDGQTQVGAPVPDFDRPPIPGQEIAPEVVSQPVASLIFSTGDVVAVDRTVLVGRAPEARRFASHDQPHVVTVASPQQEISSTHLEIRPGRRRRPRLRDRHRPRLDQRHRAGAARPRRRRSSTPASRSA